MLPPACLQTPVMTLPLRPGLGAEAAAELAVRLKRIRLAEALAGGWVGGWVAEGMSGVA